MPLLNIPTFMTLLYNVYLVPPSTIQTSISATILQIQMLIPGVMDSCVSLHPPLRFPPCTFLFSLLSSPVKYYSSSSILCLCIFFYRSGGTASHCVDIQPFGTSPSTSGACTPINQPHAPKQPQIFQQLMPPAH